MIFKAILCLFKGHDIDPKESLVGDIMICSNNWLCRCHRCRLYVMHDGAISGKSIVVTKRSAEKIAKEFREEMGAM